MNSSKRRTRGVVNAGRNEAVRAYDPDGLVLAVLLAASSLTVMAGATIAPSLPGLARHFSEVPNADFLARFALTLPALLIAISAPVMGVLVDRFGPRVVLFWSAVVYVVGGSSGIYAPDFHTILVGRGVLGIGVAGVMTATTTLIGALYPPSARDGVLGYQGAAIALGGVVFLTAGGWLAEIGWRLPFLIYALPLLLLPFILIALPKPEGTDEAASEMSGDDTAPWALLTGFYLLAVAAMVLFYIIPTQLPFRLVAAGFDDASLSGYAIAISTFASAGAALLFRRIKSAVPATGALALIFVGLGLGLLIAGALESFIVIAAAMLIAGAGAGLTMPVMNSLVLDAAPAHSRGRAASGLSTSVFLGQFLSPILMTAVVPGDDVADIFVWAGGAAILAALVFGGALALRRLRLTSNPPVGKADP